MIEFYNPNHVTVELTEAAVAHLQKSLAKVPGALGVYVGTEKAGCSGYAYVLEVLTAEKPNAVKAESRAPLAIYVDRASIDFLNGVELDVERKGLGQQAMVYRNPNEAARCGCGESFMPKERSSQLRRYTESK